MLSEVDIAIITLCECVCVCVCDFFSIIIIFNSLYISTFLTTMYICTFRKGWVSRGCSYFIGVNVLW